MWESFKKWKHGVEIEKKGRESPVVVPGWHYAGSSLSARRRFVTDTATRPKRGRAASRGEGGEKKKKAAVGGEWWRES